MQGLYIYFSCRLPTAVIIKRSILLRVCAGRVQTPDQCRCLPEKLMDQRIIVLEWHTSDLSPVLSSESPVSLSLGARLLSVAAD